MKDNVFIVWSGNKGQDLALKVKEMLELNDYKCIVGGEGGVTNGMHVGTTIINQMNTCTQAIIIVQKKENGTISNNLFFEWGYLVSHLGDTKSHVYYIDIEEHDSAIPSDLHGIWVTYLKSASVEATSEEIVNKFIAQKVSPVQRDKMSVIDLYYNLKAKISEHRCECSYAELDLAQNILFFAQSAYLFHKETDALETLRKLDNLFQYENVMQSPELDAAVDFATCYLSVLNPDTIAREGSMPYLSASGYSSAKRVLTALVKRVEACRGEGEFYKWFFMFVYDALNYICVLYTMLPGAAERRKIRIFKESITYAEISLAWCDALSSQSENTMCLNLYEAYIYRNMATAYKFLGERGVDEKYTKEAVQELMLKSLQKRSAIFDHYSNRSINTRLLENFEQEYYFALSEILADNVGKETIECENMTIDCEEALINCEEYVDNSKKRNEGKNYLLDQIQKFIENVYDSEDYE